MNSRRGRPTVPADAIGDRSTPGTWLTAAAVARAVGGKVLRGGAAANGVSTDSRIDCAGRLFVALRGKEHDGHQHVAAAIDRGAVGLLVERPLEELPGAAAAGGAGTGGNRLGAAPFVVRVADTTSALLQLAAEHRRRHRARVIGITGSCGKTTTKEWLGTVLAAAMPTVRSPGSYNNQVGVPLTLFQIAPETRAAVVEIGTNAPGEIAPLTAAARPDVGIVTCVAAAHLQGLGSLAGVAREKSDLPAGVAEDGLVILNGDDASCRAMAAVTRARVQFVAIDRQADWFATDVQFHGLGTTFRLQGNRPVTLPRLGTHNVYNALMVIAAASHLGVPEQQILQVLGEVPAASRRLEPKRVAGITVYDDTYNMNPASARAALQALAGIPGSGRRIAVFGEMRELGPRSEELHRALGEDVRQSRMDALVCIGSAAAAIADGAIAAGMPATAVHRTEDLPGALALLSRCLRDGDHVLCKASRSVALDRLVDQLLATLRSAASPGGDTSGSQQEGAAP